MEEIKEQLEKACYELFSERVDVELSRPEEKFGDYSTNIALKIAAKLNKNPREIAEAIAGKLENAEVAGPGFINIRLDDKTLAKAAQNATDLPKPLTGKKILCEYSDANPLKPLHAGHLYTTLVGDSVANLLEVAGANLVRLNYGGDVGLHTARSMWGIIQKLGGEDIKKLSEIKANERASWLGDRYVEGNNAYEEDPIAKREIVEINKKIYKLHSDKDHKSSFAQIYWTARQWSYDYLAELYKQLGVAAFDRYIPESEVFKLGMEIVNAQLQKGVYKKSHGAVIFEGERFGLHTRVFISSSGLPTYEAKDVGLLQLKWNDYHFDQSIVITADEQADYYRVMLKSVEQYEPELVKRSRHLTHGVVKLPGGVKMSSRKGNVLMAMDILNAARVAGAKTGRNPSESTVMAAVKYAFDKVRIGSGDIIYDPAGSVALEGNSGPYLQYAYARAKSILAKAQEKPGEISNLEPDERSLARKISQYPEVVAEAIKDYAPSHVCTYLYELAQQFNSFYEKNRVIGDKREDCRLTLVEAYAKVLKHGLRLLNIDAPDKI